MKIIGSLLIVLVLAACSHASKSPENESSATSKQEKMETKAICFQEDKIKDWEIQYLLLESGANDVESEVYLEAYKKFKKSRKVPRAKCERIIWLKERACRDDAASGHTRLECMTDPKYLEKIDSEPYTGP